jgi:hypothetical protein
MAKWKAGNSVSTRRVIARQLSSDVLLANSSSQTELQFRRSRYLSETAKNVLSPQAAPKQNDESAQLGKGFLLFRSLFPADISPEARDIHSKASYRASNHLTVRPKLSSADFSQPAEPLDMSNQRNVTVKVANSPQRRRINNPSKRSLVLPDIEEEMMTVRHALTYPMETKKQYGGMHGKRTVMLKKHPELFTGTLPYILGGVLTELK